MAEKMKKRAPLRCRIPAKLVGVSPSAIYSTGCSLGRTTSNECVGCPKYFPSIPFLYEQIDRKPFISNLSASYADIEHLSVEDIQILVNKEGEHG